MTAIWWATLGQQDAGTRSPALTTPQPLARSAIEYIGPEKLTAIMRPRDAVAAITAALRGGLDPGEDPPRTVLDLPDRSGQLLVMPAASRWAAGVKVITAAPGNPTLGLPRIQGIHLVFEPTTLRLVAAVDGAALTALRTPAVSVAAVLPLLERREHPMSTVVFGAGPQAVGHVTTLRDIGCELRDVTYVVRDPSGVDASALGSAEVISPAAVEPRLHRADLVVCATTSQVPVFNSRHLPPHAIVLAVCSHERHAREVDAALVARSQVVVEDVSTALRECGDIVMAIDEGVTSATCLVSMAEVARGETILDGSRPVLFKGSGMAWQDLVIADAAVRRHQTD